MKPVRILTVLCLSLFGALLMFIGSMLVPWAKAQNMSVSTSTIQAQETIPKRTPRVLTSDLNGCGDFIFKDSKTGLPYMVPKGKTFEVTMIQYTPEIYSQYGHSYVHLIGVYNKYDIRFDFSIWPITSPSEPVTWSQGTIPFYEREKLIGRIFEWTHPANQIVHVRLYGIEQTNY